jgi:hypothetical protein
MVAVKMSGRNCRFFKEVGIFSLGSPMKKRHNAAASRSEWNMNKAFYVVGGEFADTTFQNIGPGKTEERYGPFNEKEALDVWRSLTGRTVDNALIRYFVKQDETQVAAKTWYVVGGEYSDTHFQTLSPNAKLQVYGPFARQEAMDYWRNMTGKTIDSAVTRFEIVVEDDLETFKARF